MSSPADTALAGLGLEELLSIAGGAPVPVEAAASPDTAVAIVGLAARIGSCADLETFWELLRDGGTTLRRLPPGRARDLAEFLHRARAQHSHTPLHALPESFLDEVDKFDYRFFGIARQEANLMDPNQRLFLETAWTALEDAGYAGASVRGSATGVFVGLSADFGETYRDVVRALAPDAPEVSVVGNVKSIIASRLAYQLDLRGPTLVVDTACSSGLVALHLARRALLAGDCEMAIAGAVKTDLVPVSDNPETRVGVKDIEATMAGDGLTRTFDDAGAGTSAAEGVLAFVLKPLARALADGDTVHAVIRGSAVNQDGHSVGITAPNMAAQEALVASALRDAEVHPESISYLEAHGTATRLGDPIEVSGLSRAFARFSRRRQFCAIGSVKTNVGHLDSAAGLAGLAKVVLALRHRQLPASLNFARPNARIDFAHSPVFVNDTLRAWHPPEPGVPLRAGINSFGLSGTNCHVVVEEPAAPASPAPTLPGPYLLALSAASAEQLEQLLGDWHRHLGDCRPRPQDLCFTAALGRLHHAHRVAIRFDDLADLRRQLATLLAGAPAAASATVTRGTPPADGTSPSAAERRELERAAAELGERLAGECPRETLLEQAAELYARGADLPWERWFAPGSCRRVPLPTYPFARTRCWVETSPLGMRAAGSLTARQLPHPLLDARVAVSKGLRIYETVLGADTHWALAEHRVQSRCVLPGTAFIEMLLAVAAELHGGVLPPLEIEQLLFLEPLALADEERRALQLTVLDAEDGTREVRFCSQPRGAGEWPSEDWQVHAEGVWRPAAAERPPRRDIAALRAALPEPIVYSSSDDERRGLSLGGRWARSVQQAWTNAERDTVLVQLQLDDGYGEDAGRYHCHPALLDNAVNAANHLAGDGELYLPFAYRRLEVFAPLPTAFHALLRRRPGASAEAFPVDVELLGADGAVCARASDYTLKRVASGDLDSAHSPLHVVRLVPRQLAAPAAAAVPEAPIALVCREGEEPERLAAALRRAGAEVLVLRAPAPGTVATDYDAQLAPLAGRRLAGLIHTLGWPTPGADADALLLDLCELVRACEQHRLRADGALLVTRGAFTLADDAVASQPHAAALAALARIVRLENPQLPWRCVDSDALPTAATLLAELAGAAAQGDLAVWRDGACHGERLESLPVPAPPRFVPRADGVYVITGGTGALGLELAALMAARGPVNLALLASGALPPPGDWERLARAPDTPEKLRRCIARLQALRASGASIDCVVADVADPAAMGRALDALRDRYGRINGVVHAAGRPGEGFLRNKPAATFERVLAPKLAGTRVLHELTLDDPLEFFVMYSSVATVLRSAGQSDYTAANAYLDAFARYRRSLGLPAVSVCWPAWREIGIAREYAAVDETESFAPIATADALPLIERLLCDDGHLPPAVIAAEINPRAGTAPLDALGIDLPRAVRARLLGTGAPAPAPEAPGDAAAGLTVRGIDLDDEIASTVAALWSRILGVSEWSADDAFADHGGNSILTTQLYREYEARYPGALDVVDLFTCTTVREQVERIRKAQGVASPDLGADGPGEIDMDSVLARLAEGSLTAEQAESILSN